jgi:hypothetical protein
MNLAAPAIRVELARPALGAARAEAARRVPLAAARVPATRRAVVGCAWALAWTLVWGLAIEAYSHRAQRAPAQVVVDGAVAHPAPARLHGRR